MTFWAQKAKAQVLTTVLAGTAMAVTATEAIMVSEEAVAPSARGGERKVCRLGATTRCPGAAWAGRPTPMAALAGLTRG